MLRTEQENTLLRKAQSAFQNFPIKAANLAAGLIVHGAASAGVPMNLGTLRLKDIDDLRDHWAHYFSRPEQERLIRLAVRGRTENRAGGNLRGLLFVGGDLHCGGLFVIDIKEPACSFECLIRNRQGYRRGISGFAVDGRGPGIRSRRRDPRDSQVSGQRVQFWNRFGQSGPENRPHLCSCGSRRLGL